MERNTGVVARGIRAPIIRPGDDLVDIVVNSISKAAESENIKLRENDIVGVTEAVVAKAQNNFATLDDIKTDIESKYNEELGLVFPILSRNRFSSILKGVSSSVKKIFIQLSYPADEVGNHLISQDVLDATNINPYSDILTEEEFYKYFKESKHEFTGVDYIKYYKEICEGKATIIFANDPRAILKYTKNVLVADIHNRKRTKRVIKEAGAEIIYGLEDILAKPVNNSGYNPEYGLLGSNLSTDDKLKLFPRDCDIFVDSLQKKLEEKFNVNLNVLVYGDGAYKDPVGKIWELADPVVSPAYTKMLGGTPNELKIKYIADTKLNSLNGDDAEKELINLINNKPRNK